MAGKGHEERFPSTRLSAGYGFRKETIATVRHNGRNAPIAVILATANRADLMMQAGGPPCQWVSQ
jgi:hypothetical protein